MIISITNTARETGIVAVGLLLALALSARRAKDDTFFPLSTSTELKGLAILMVLFAHIGYYLVSDHRFLVPLSNYAGVGVDLFFLLSGYGLAASALRRPLSIRQFYIKRLFRIFIPVMTTVLFFVTIDFIFLHQTYPFKTVVENMLGFVPHANLYTDIDSPLWYITPLLGYYLLFPLIFWRRFPVLSAALAALFGWLFIRYSPQFSIVSSDLLGAYKLHFLSFPLGVALAGILNRASQKTFHLPTVLRYMIIVLAAGVLFYTFHHSHVGEDWKKEAATSLLSVAAVLAIFLFKKINFKMLTLLGALSFEIYLLHWPLLYRYNFLYGRLPAGIATLAYLAFFLGLGYLTHKLYDLK